MIGRFILVTVILVILYGIYGPTEDGREPYPSDVSEFTDINSLGLPFNRLTNATYITADKFKGPEDVAIDH